MTISCVFRESVEGYRSIMKKANKKQGKGKTKGKKQKYVPLKPLFGKADDYWIYKMSPLEKITGAGIGFALGFLVCMIFFRSFLFSIVAGVVMIPPACIKYQNYLKKKRQRNLLLQFRDMMEALTASYSTGKNTQDAFQDAYLDMVDLYGKKSDIACEIELIVTGLYNGMVLNDLLMNFAARSHLDDIESFATIFQVCSQYGGDLRKVVGETRVIIGDKISTELEIETLLTANKNELNIMTVMPLLIMLTLNGAGNMSIVQNTSENIVVKLAALGLFAAAYLWGKKIIEIKV